VQWWCCGVVLIKQGLAEELPILLMIAAASELFLYEFTINHWPQPESCKQLVTL
jgi:hypothetical protein